MLFDSPAFIAFLIPVVFILWRLNHGTQNVFLLLASYFFYGWWGWRFLALLLGRTRMDFLVSLELTLQPGISFYTFQEVAYIVDVYKGRIAASRSFVEYGLFISFFAQA